MNNYKVLAVFLLLMLVNINAYNVAESSQNTQDSSTDINYYEKGYRYNIQGWVYIHIEGEPYERGYQYGYLASAEIIDMINVWSEWGSKSLKLFSLLKFKSPEDYWEKCKSKVMRSFEGYYPKEYKEEIRGIILVARYSVLATRSSVLGTRFSELGTRNPEFVKCNKSLFGSNIKRKTNCEQQDLRDELQ